MVMYGATHRGEPTVPRSKRSEKSPIFLGLDVSKASRSGIKAFVTVAKTIRKRKEGILAAVRLKINNECASYCASL